MIVAIRKLKMNASNRPKLATAFVSLLLGIFYAVALTNSYVDSRKTQELAGIVWWLLPFTSLFLSFGVSLIIGAAFDCFYGLRFRRVLVKVVSGFLMLGLVTALFT